MPHPNLPIYVPPYTNVNTPGWIEHNCPQPHRVYKYYKEIYMTLDESYVVAVCSLYWTGKRYMVWVRDTLIAEPTELMEIDNPPFDWALSLYNLGH